MATKMRKAVVSAFGDSSNINIVTTEILAPGRNEVQVEIIYAGFSGADINMRLGCYPMQRAAPLTPGYCFVGRVRQNGHGSTKYQMGNVVAAVTVYDSDAEMINIPEKYLTPVSDGVPLQQAAALALDWNTAFAMVTHTAKVSKGQRVFVHGLSGAVGYAAMIICQMQGAIVYGTASQRNHDDLKALGATPYVYTNKDWIARMQELGGAHAVFDPLGFESWDESYSILSSKEPSVLVGYGGNMAALSGGVARSPYPFMAKLMSRNMALWSKKSTRFYAISRDDKTLQPDLLALMKLVKEKRIQAPIKRVWDLIDIKAAHESWGKISGMGSMLIRVRSKA